MNNMERIKEIIGVLTSPLVVEAFISYFGPLMILVIMGWVGVAIARKGIRTDK